MKKIIEKISSIFAAVSFAEEGEWEDAVKMADGSLQAKAADGVQVKPKLKKVKKAVDNRPQLRL